VERNDQKPRSNGLAVAKLKRTMAELSGGLMLLRANASMNARLNK
jgi:hypothetical protein